jgi:hypothetical protein
LLLLFGHASSAYLYHNRFVFGYLSVPIIALVSFA